MRQFYSFLDKHGLQLVIKRHQGTFIASLRTYHDTDILYRKLANHQFHHRSAPGETPDLAIANLAKTLSDGQVEVQQTRAATIRGAKASVLEVPRFPFAA